MTRRILTRLAAALAVAVAAPLSLTACSSANDANTLHIIAGSEIKDMQPILEDLTRETGVHLEFEYMGTLDGTETLLASGDDRAWQASWFPSNRYLSLFPDGDAIVESETSIMRSPVVLGVKPDVAAQLGWSDQAQPTWQQVVDAVDAGRLRFGMTSPVASNSGFTTLVEAATALSGTGAVLADADIAAVTPALERLARGQSLAAGSSGWLAEKFQADPSSADAIFNYESVLKGLGATGTPLQIVIPSDGVVTSDYPLALLSGASEEQRANYDKVIAYLTQPDVQQRIADVTNRRTSATPPSMDATVFELPFPAKLETVQTLLEAWVANVKKPSNMTFAIDTSGSMSGGRMNDLRSALHVLSGSGGQSTTDQFLRFQPREQISYLEFSSDIKSSFTTEIPSDQAGYAQAMQAINSRIDAYQAGGNTNIYGTLQRAYEEAIKGAGDDAITSIVLFTDGERTSGPSDVEFERWYRDFVAAHPEAASVPVYVILFGEADVDEMTALATTTGGRTFDASSDSLASVFKEIRGYL